MVKTRNVLIYLVCTLWVGFFFLLMSVILVGVYQHRNDKPKMEVKK